MHHGPNVRGCCRLLASGLKSDAQAGNAIPAHAPTSVLAATHDFNGDGKSDILWLDSGSRHLAIWFMNGGAVSSSAFVAAAAIYSPTTVSNLNAN